MIFILLVSYIITDALPEWAYKTLKKKHEQWSNIQRKNKK